MSKKWGGGVHVTGEKDLKIFDVLFAPHYDISEVKTMVNVCLTLRVPQ